MHQLAAVILTLRCISLSAAEVELHGHKFTLPDHLTIEQVAGPPLVSQPISADFDDQGRLYVTDVSGTNENVKVQAEKKAASYCAARRCGRRRQV